MGNFKWSCFLCLISSLLLVKNAYTQDNSEYEADSAAFYYEYVEEYNYEDSDYENTDVSTTDRQYSNYEYEYYKDYLEAPVFTSATTEYLVDLGNTARLTCSVDKLDSRVISWKKGDVILAIGEKLLTSEDALASRMTVEVTNTSSVLTIALFKQTDTGDYECTVHSQTPITQIHRVEVRFPAEVEILNLPAGVNIRELAAGDTLRLECQGKGDPQPTLRWSRENSLLPSGEPFLEQDSLEYQFVDQKHSGLYTCTGSNGFGEPDKKTVNVTVKHTPILYVHHNYVDGADNSVASLELVCAVQAYPAADVSWTRQDRELDSSRSRMEIKGGKHILVIDHPLQYDIGLYSCFAKNSEGEVHAVLDIPDEGKLIPSESETNGDHDFLQDSPQLNQEDTAISQTKESQQKSVKPTQKAEKAHARSKEDDIYHRPQVIESSCSHFSLHCVCSLLPMLLVYKSFSN